MNVSSSRRTIAVASLVALSVVVLADPGAARRKKEPGAATVQGKVVSPAGDPVAAVAVHVSGGDPPVAISGVTDAEGKFELEVMPPAAGELEITFEHPEFALFRSDLVLEPGEIQNVEVRLVDAAADARQRAVTAFNSGVAALEAEDREKARDLFVRAAELDPGLAEAHLALADLYLRESWLSEAKAAVERFRSLRPDDERGRRLLFEVLRRQGDVEAAQALADQGEPDDALRSSLAIELYNDAVARLQEGKKESAYGRFEEAHRTDPELVPALEGLATVAYDLARYDDALRWADVLLELSSRPAEEGGEPGPPNERALRTRFLVFDARDDGEAAAKALDAYLRVAPEAGVDLLYRRADLDFRAGAVAEAEAALRRILDLDPDHPRAHYTMGLVRMSTDQAAARRHLERFLELAPDDPEAVSAREMLEHL